MCTSNQRSESFFHHFSASLWCAGADADALALAAAVATGLVRGVSHGRSMAGGAGIILGPGPRKLHNSWPHGRWRGVDLLRGGFTKHAGVRLSKTWYPAHVLWLWVEFMASAAEGEGPTASNAMIKLMISQGRRGRWL